ncbi:unannotated protein [freshwater metagenome]|uniref:Unannotated protein n=1 Tax=freshwater metagenome TaxID=449393 RepID=A0A6J7ET85_9ZZZZ|nr:PASTA domain-containing protein [Actinomycetota bacterium]
MATIDALSGLLLAGRYRLHQRRSSAGDGTVMEAVDEQLQRLVAVKILGPEWAATPATERRFRAEAQVASSLTHPNVNAVYDWGIETLEGVKRPYLVLEYLAGGSLRDILDRGRLLSPSQALMVGLDVCRGLDYIHRRGIVHRDLRPAMLVFGDDRRLRLINVGVARMVAEQVWANPSAVGINAARYASPEQAQGGSAEDGTVGPPSDIYALCLVLIESVTGQVPFAADSTVATLNARIDKLMPVSADFGPLAAVLERAGRPLAADRFTAAELGRALMQAAERLPRPAPIAIAGGGQFGEHVGAASLPAEPDLATAEPVVAADVAPTEPAPAPDVPIYDQAVEPRHRGRRVLATLALALALVAGGFVAYRTMGATAHEVPDLVGLDKGVAENQIADDGWTLIVQTERSDAQAQGKVIRTEPAAGTKFDEGKTFVLVVSDGPTLPKLIDVTGMTLDAATSTLSGMSLAVAVAGDAYDETVPSGTVLSWTVPAQPSLTMGAEVVQGTVIAVTVSKGPAPRDVPNLVGLDETGATAALTAVQLTIVRADDIFSSTVPVGQVADQSLAPGTKVDRGSSVTIAVSKGPDLVLLPELSGLDFASIQEALVSAGFTVGTVTGNTNGYLYAVQVAGNPVVVGQQIVRGTAIDLFYF